MKRLMKYLKTRKGIALVYVALMLAVLLMLAGVAIDGAYMYNVKNQLQVAADAAALAGAGALDGSSATLQISARRATWQFACRNSAAGSNVFLVSDGANCDDVPGNLNNGNNPQGDIVLGNWNSTRPAGTTPCEDQRFLPAVLCDGTVVPLPATTPPPTINAVKALPRRTGETPGMPPVRVFLGGIFRVIGGDWSLMSAKASAVAAMPPRASSFVAMGSTACPPGCEYPAKCPITPPRVVVASPTSGPDDHKFGWTSLLRPAGNCNTFKDMMCNNSPYEDACSGPGIWGISGTCSDALRDYASLMYDPGYDARNKQFDAAGKVIGWEVMFPQTVSSDPMFGPDPHPVMGYLLVHIFAVCAPGTTGCRGYGAQEGMCGPPSGLYPNNSIVIDSISCISCSNPAFGLRPVLVK